jgi:tetratricopeptide (TPR) repeat protein
VYNNLANAYRNLGDWNQASDAYYKSLTIAQEIGHIYNQGMVANNLANIHLDRGEWSQAVSLYEHSLAIWKQIGAAMPEALTLSNLAQVHIYQENWAEAQECLSRSQAIFAEVSSEEYLSELLRRWGEFYLKTGELDQALAYTRRSIELTVVQGDPLEEGMSCRMLGQVHLARGEWEPAKAALHQSLQILSDLNSEYEAAKTMLSLARLARESGSISDEAREYLMQAIKTFEKLGAQADLVEAQGLEQELHHLNRCRRTRSTQ